MPLRYLVCYSALNAAIAQESQAGAVIITEIRML